jgi:hypothetical protein
MYYLLFDASCAACSSTAQRVTELGRGRIVARSLQDPAIQARLDELHPGWTVEPLLLEETSAGARVLSGMTMRRRIVQELGVRRGLEVWRLSREAGAVRASSPGMTRQRFLRRAAAAAGGAALTGPAAAAAASAAGGRGGRVNRAAAELLGADAPAVKRLRSSRVVAQAGRAFDGIDLSGALRVPATAETPETLVVSLGQTAVLIVADHATASETGLVLESAETNAGLELVWKQPDGSSIGTTRIAHDGRVHSVAATGATFVDGRRTSGARAAAVPFVECFVACVGLSGVTNCADDCLKCAATKFPPTCVTCLSCAGSKAIKCARQCL